MTAPTCCSMSCAMGSVYSEQVVSHQHKGLMAEGCRRQRPPAKSGACAWGRNLRRSFSMTDLAVRLALKERLPRTWLAFFERHGNFTAVQLATIPPLLDGHNVIVCAPTASGKT